MKNILLLIAVLLFSLSTNAMFIRDITVTSLNTQDVNIHLKVQEGSVFIYSDYSTNINNNTITLTVCYIMELFQSVTTLENDFIIPNINLFTSNYNLVVIVNYKNFPNNICENSIFSDTETINFSTPLSGVVSLSNSSFEAAKDHSTIYPNPFNQSFTITKSAGKIEEFEFKIIDITGRVVLFGKSYYDEKINTENLLSGNYFLEIRDKSSLHEVRKLVKD